ncbi:ribosome-associated translation inhibitor RaiA [Litoribacter ruber]|uniref:Ribosome-associated translation inhibitor RaiA n=1 Tax=Litoribacter ruber TaxID=702568 RepID=A0AAP2CET8_9BACT|nr:MULTISPECIES: ribosome-associated translation inhibitor RaiA [Litoribacter]MBS9522512.1 ribosome-associated translation inhibitor RaiA [Litoribacter alkaliphilus]MBT0811032.1 ribosome-associated translation inhibitor RaiA [Litoribacter ruber]
MNYTENYKGIKIDVQAVNLEIGDAVQQEVRASIDKLLRFTQEINWVDVYFKTEGSNGQDHKVGMKVGIPGPDVFAEEDGEHYVPMLKNVTDKLVRQLQKNK